jgi:hypothetical protein
LQARTLIVPRRFHGPPTSGNGGWVCGRLGQLVAGDGGGAAVRLRVPPPLDTELEVRPADAGVVLLQGETVVAEGRPARVSIEPGGAPSWQEAEAASRGFRGFTSHWFPSCFVCGTEREPGDGLRIFPGPLAGGDRIAAPWIPGASLAASSADRVAPEFLWAALDCPGAFAFPDPAAGVALLGELQVALRGDVSVGERCVLVAWEVLHQGRKHHTATALFGEAGDCRAVGLATWIEVPSSGGARAGGSPAVVGSRPT